jgi:hypothetical protein
MWWKVNELNLLSNQAAKTICMLLLLKDRILIGNVVMEKQP